MERFIFLLFFALFVSGCTSENNEISKDDNNPILVIEYDDGSLKDFTLAFPIHQAYGVPATTNIITELVSENSEIDSSFMNKEQILELYNEGWEISNHTSRHNNLAPEQLIYEIKKGDTKIYVEKASYFRPDIGGDTIGIIEDSGKFEEVTFISRGEDERGTYLNLASPISQNFSESAYFRLSNEEYNNEILKAQKELESWGLEVTGFAYPYGIQSEFSKEFISKTHRVARGVWNNPNLGNLALNNEENIINNPFNLYSVNFEYLTEEDVVKILDSTVKTGSICIMYAHTYNDTFSTEMLEFIITEALERDIQILTRAEAVKKFVD